MSPPLEPKGAIRASVELRLPRFVNAQLLSELRLWPRSVMAPRALPPGIFSESNVFTIVAPVVLIPPQDADPGLALAPVQALKAKVQLVK